MNNKVKNKALYCVFGILSLIQTGYSQEAGNQAFASIQYGFEHIVDTTKRDQPHKEHMILYIGREGSIYKNYTLEQKMKEAQKRMEESGAIAGGRNQAFALHINGVSNEELYTFPGQQELTTVNQIGKTTYYIPESYPEINWKVTDDKKTIGGYSCQKAIGHFGGRSYSAWFTMALPFPYGPWKLHGLPGLILEAEDDKKEVIFRYMGFDKLSDVQVDLPIQIPQNAIKTNAASFRKAKVAFDKDPTGNMMRSAPQGANVKTKMVFKDANGRELSPDEARAMREMATKKQATQMNNPLELDNK